MNNTTFLQWLSAVCYMYNFTFNAIHIMLYRLTTIVDMGRIIWHIQSPSLRKCKFKCFDNLVAAAAPVMSAMESLHRRKHLWLLSWKFSVTCSIKIRDYNKGNCQLTKGSLKKRKEHPLQQVTGLSMRPSTSSRSTLVIWDGIHQLSLKSYYKAKKEVA